MITDPNPVNPVHTHRQSRASSRRRAAPGDDIPLALRTSPRARKPFPWLIILGLAAAGMALGVTALTRIVPEPLRSWFTLSSVAVGTARPGLDGRLLGHFPYPQAAEHDLVELGAGQRLHRDAAPELLAMVEAARSDGVALVVLSAYRSVNQQKALFFDVKSERNQSARERARVSAPPGYSEHSTGYAVDLGDGTAPGANLAERFDRTAAFRWLNAHAHRYHFTLSFPLRNRQGVSYEPWHWRFEGTAAALKVFEPAERFSSR